MAEPVLSTALLDMIRRGDEELDRGLRGPWIELALLREAGLLSAPLTVGEGGAAWGTGPEGALPMLDALTALGGASLPVARIYEGHVNAIKLVLAHAAGAQRAIIAASVRGGAVLGVWGADSGSPVTIEDSTGHARLAGAKTFASGLGDVDLAIITARTAAGTQMVLADVSEQSRARHEHWDVVAMVGSRSGRFDCTGLPAGPAQYLGGVDALFGEPDFHGGLWRLAACYAGALMRMARQLAELIRMRDTRSTSLTQSRLGHVAVEAESAYMWAREACLAVERSAVPAAQAVRTSLFALEAIERATARALPVVERIVGTEMHRRTSAVGRLARDLRFYQRQADLDGKLALATGYWIQEIAVCG